MKTIKLDVMSTIETNVATWAGDNMMLAYGLGVAALMLLAWLTKDLI